MNIQIVEESGPQVSNAAAKHAAHSILVVDGDVGGRVTMKWFLSVAGYAVDVAATAQEALTRLVERPYDVVLTESTLPGNSAAELAQTIHRHFPLVAVALLAAEPPPDSSAFDLIVRKTTHLMGLRVALNNLRGR